MTPKFKLSTLHLTFFIRFEHVGDDPPPPPLPPGMIPPEADESGEPDKKRARKSRWDPVEEEKPFVDRKRLSELEFLSFYPVWDFRKMARYLSHESKA
jgi:hypothetical protein